MAMNDESVPFNSHYLGYSLNYSEYLDLHKVNDCLFIAT